MADGQFGRRKVTKMDGSTTIPTDVPRKRTARVRTDAARPGGIILAKPPLRQAQRGRRDIQVLPPNIVKQIAAG